MVLPTEVGKSDNTEQRIIYNIIMDWGYLVEFLYEFAYFLGVFSLFLVFAVLKGRQALINIITGLYLALLILLEFPNYDKLFGDLEGTTAIFATLGLFVVITIFTTALMYRVMPEEFREERFESLWKKILLSLGATLLVMIFSFQTLPLTDLLAAGTPLQSLFGPEPYFFWWLLVPLVILYVV